jgi:hypothetical protein
MSCIEWELYIDDSYPKYRNAECRMLTNRVLVTGILFKWQKRSPLNWGLILKNAIRDRTGQIVALSAFSMQIWKYLLYWTVFEYIIIIFTSLADGINVTSVFCIILLTSDNLETVISPIRSNPKNNNENAAVKIVDSYIELRTKWRALGNLCKMFHRGRPQRA